MLDLVSYPGGKAGPGVYQRIISMMPPHDIYIEPFLGGGAIMRHKRPARRSIGLDRARAAIDLFVYDGQEGVELQNADALIWLKQNQPELTEDTLIYMDPPYPRGTRKQQRDIYQFEMTTEDHLELLALAGELPCMVMISSYWSELYAACLKDWRVESFTTTTRGGSIATEYVWLNFPEPFELHDYRYLSLGGNFTDRQRIKRKQERWLCRLRDMPPQERYAMLAVLQDAAL